MLNDVGRPETSQDGVFDANPVLQERIGYLIKLSRVLQNQQEKCVLTAKLLRSHRSTWLRRASASSADGPAAVRRRVRACQERETVAGSALTGSNLADVG